MYQAKRAGRARQAFFDESVRAETARRLERLSDLRHAVEVDALELHYQPVHDLGSGRVWGVEALVRWRTAKGEAVTPAEFIPLAEEEP